MQPQDALKLCYQAAFGAEHLLLDTAAARGYLKAEFSAVDAAADVPLCEPISKNIHRVNLAAWKAAGLPLAWLFSMFQKTAAVPHQSDAHAQFAASLEIVSMLADSAKLPFALTDWQRYIDAYMQTARGPVHHSDAYRQAERPAYRIVTAAYTRLIPLLLQLHACAPGDTPCVVAIDGRSASGKTTVAAQLSAILDADAVHMDDFFLPAELRSSERFATPGGNVHHERFAAEVLPHLAKKDSFSYRMFDCGTMEYGADRCIKASDYRIVEGSYSCHPALGDYMHVRVFCDVDADEQMRRIVARNGQDMARMFAERWIPMEEAYFAENGTKDKADLVLGER